MIHAAVPRWENARVLENGCGVGVYIPKLRRFTPQVHGLDFEFERAAAAARAAANVICAAGEHLPYAEAVFDVILSNEVIEHVQDDRAALCEMARALRPGGRLVLFCPNRWYPVEQHGIYWRGRYIFGNIPLVNYLPDPIRNRLAPHVRTYTGRGLRRLLQGTRLKVVHHSIIFGGYDNLIARFGPFGRLIRGLLYVLENTPLQLFGLSHFLVAEKL
jgi:SAM-dependent methyltransferase